MRILNNKKGKMFKYTKEHNCFWYINNSGQKRNVRTGDMVEVEGFELPCKIGHTDCKGCTILSDSDVPICLMYGGTYGIEEVME